MKSPAKSTQKAAVRWLLGRTEDCRLQIGLAIGSGVLFGLLVIWQARLMAGVVHAVFMDAFGPGDVEPMLGELLGVFVLRGLLRWIREICGFAAGARVRSRLRRQLNAHWSAQGPVRMAGHPAGALTATAMEQVEALQGFYALYLPQLVVAVVVPGAVAATVLPVSWAAGGLLLLTAPLIPLFMVLVGMGAESASQRHFQTLARMSAHFLDTLKGLPTLKLLARSQTHAADVSKAAQTHRRRTMKVLQIAFLSSAVLEFFSAMAIALVAVYLGMHYLGYFSFGSYGTDLSFQQGFFILLLAPEFYWPLRELGAHYHARAEAIGAAVEIMPLIAAHGPPPQADLRPTEPTIKTPDTADPMGVRFEAVSFAYDGSRRPVIDNMHFELPAGTATALVGPSGAGKTTVVNLLLGFLEPDSGRVLVQGKPPVSPSAANPIAWIGQDPYLFHGSLAENIRLARPQASTAQVRQAARDAGVLDFTDRLPNGLDTIVAEAGIGLSRGQAQRVALARAFLKDAPILLLDEPTASLDPDSESRVIAAIERLRRGRTVLLVTHRLDRLDKMDRIIVVDNGAITEAGPYQALKTRGGVFASMLTAAGPLFSGVDRSTEPIAGSDSAATHLDDIAPPPAPPAKSAAALRIWRPLLRLMGRHWSWMLLGAFLGWVALTAGIGLLALSGWFLSAAAWAGLTAATAQAFNFFIPSIGVRLCAIVRTAARYAERLVTHSATFRILAQLRVWFYRRLEPLAPAGLSGFRSGDLLNRIVTDIDVLDNLYARVISPSAAALFAIAGVSAGLSWIDPTLALYTIAWLGLAAVALPAAVTAAGRRWGRRIARQQTHMRSLLVDGLRGMAELVIFSSDGRHAQQLAACNRRLVAAQARMSHINGTGAGAILIIAGLATVTALYIGAGCVAQGRMPGTQLALAALAVLAAFESLQPLPAAFQYLGQTREAGRRLMSVVAQPPPVVFQTDTIRPLPDAAVCFERVRFAYPGQITPVLDAFSLTLAPGEHVVLVGESGTGKSTVGALLARFWDPQSGRITIGGHDLRQFSESALRDLLNLADQNAHLFNDSIRANLLLANPGADESDLKRVLEQACLLDFVKALPNGLDTWVGELGYRLSGGQARRLVMARTLLRDGRVWILDEPTEGIDSPTADRMMQQVLAAARHRTVMVITHRPVDIGRFDRCLRLSDGRLHPV